MIHESLRRRLTIRVGAVFVVVLFLDSLACYFIAKNSADVAYDSWLVDSARSLSKALQVRAGKVSFEMPHVGLDVFQFDAIDKTYFHISSQRQGFIAGDPTLPTMKMIHGNSLRLGDAVVVGRRVRLVATYIDFPGINDVAAVEIGETLVKRSTLTSEILLAMATPQVCLLIGALLLAWFGISAWLRPLTNLAAQIEARDHDNLTPVPAAGLPNEARALVATINSLLGKLQEAMFAQKRFVADAAHQLRTPIAAILLYTENAQRVAGSDEERSALRGLHTAAERTARLSRQLLSLARADPVAMSPVDLKAVDIGALARKIGEEFIPVALSMDIDFGLVVPDSAVMVLGNSDLLAELLSNLIDNALRYGTSGGRVTVLVGAAPNPSISVEDDGPGIPIADRERVFERFKRLEGSTKSGCGLGLAIVSEIAQLHGAAVRIEDNVNARGARFVVTFPHSAPVKN